MSAPGFAVDLDELLDVVDELVRCGVALDALLDDVVGRVAALQQTWSGSAADAQAGAQAEWERGFREMSAALAVMRSAADTAHDNYERAATTNLRMWEQVR